MKKMFEYDLVRRMYYRDDLTRREISHRTGHHRETIRKMLKYPSPPGYRLQQPRPKSKLDPYLSIIDKILEDDRSAPKNSGIRPSAFLIGSRQSMSSPGDTPSSRIMYGIKSLG